MKKIFLRTLCLILCLITIIFMLTSCNSKYIELGPYSISEKEYVYLLGMYKKRLLVSMDVTESQMSQQISSSVTLGEYLDTMYISDFQDTVFSLLFAQSLFDDYGLELSAQTQQIIENNVETIASYFEALTGETFNSLAKQYGFNKSTLKSVYTMQKKESMVLEYLYGTNYENVSKEDKDAYYEDMYFHFQVIVVNNAYKKVERNGEEAYVALSAEEKEEKNKIISDLTALLIDGKTPYYGEGEAPEGSYKYEVIDPTKSYDELYREYSFDQTYKDGYYMQNPTAYQLQTVNTYTTAYLLKENDYGMSDFIMSLSSSDAASVGLSGENPVCGKTFIMKLPLAEEAYEDEENTDFFGEKSTFYMNSAIYAYGNFLKEYQYNNMFVDDFTVNSDMYDQLFTTVKANELDYYFLYQSEE